jgi:DNA-binding response OmpR family regulator
MTKILLIEDEAQHSDVVKLRLSAQGMQVCTAATAAGGAAAAAKENPDLILLDLILPDLTPEDSIKGLKAALGKAKTPIVAFTALDPIEIHRRRLDKDLSGIVSKPYEARDLLSKIKRLTGK